MLLRLHVRLFVLVGYVFCGVVCLCVCVALLVSVALVLCLFGGFPLSVCFICWFVLLGYALV